MCMTVDSSAPNGDAQPPAPAPVSEAVPEPSQPPSTALEPVPPSSEPPVSQDTEKKDSNETVAEPPAADEALEANGTPAQKKGGNGKRKSSTGIPEHKGKGKKLNKKKSMNKITHLDAQPGDIFFARLKSYPPWPSIVCDEAIPS